MEDEFGPLDWYRAKTVEQMRSDLVTMAEGNYFDDNQEYAFMAGGNLVIRTGAELNDQAPEGPGPEEYQMMSDEEIVEQYVTRIKMYPPFVDIEDKEGFASAFLPALDNMNNVASVYGNDVQYGDGMTLASEIQTGAITDYITTGFKDKAEFFEWYLSDVANNQVVLQPGQKQAEDFSIVDASFYDNEEPFDDPMSTPNTKFPRKPEQQEDVFGELDWYKAKTVEEMRSDLITMAKGDYFNNEQSYVFKASGKIVIRSGEEINDQAPEGPGPEEYQMMSDEQIVQQYITRIKMYPPLVQIENKEEFASAFLPALDNMNNVASVYGNDVQYGNGMELASEIQTGAITDYIATGFKDTNEFYGWYLSDVANHQVVLQPGQTQAEDFSVVDEGFYDDPMTTPNTRFEQKPVEEPIAPPNTRFERNPRIQSKDTVFKQPGKNYYNMLKTLTKVGEAVKEMPSATADFLGSAAKGPVELGKKVVENVQQGMETAQKAPSLLEIIERLRNNPGSMNIPTEE